MAVFPLFVFVSVSCATLEILMPVSGLRDKRFTATHNRQFARLEVVYDGHSVTIKSRDFASTQFITCMVFLGSRRMRFSWMQWQRQNNKITGSLLVQNNHNSVPNERMMSTRNSFSLGLSSTSLHARFTMPMFVIR